MERAHVAGPPRRARRRVLRAGTWAGLVAWSLLLAWIPVALWEWSRLSVPGYAAVVLALAALTGLALRITLALRELHVPVVLALPVGWVAVEWLRAHLPGPLAFPWLELGVSLTPVPGWLGVAELVGSRGVSFWLAAVGGLLAGAWVARGRRRAVPAVAALVLFGGVALAGEGRSRALGEAHRESRAFRAVLLQPDIPQSIRRDPAAVRAATRRSLERLLARRRPAEAEAAERPHLIVLPEALLPDTLGPGGAGEAPASPSLPEALGPLAERSREVPVLFGGVGRAREPGEGLTNSAFLLRDGDLDRWRYDKRHLVAAVERVPLVPAPWFPEGFSGYHPGAAYPVMEVAAGGGPPVRVGVTICFESAFSRAARGLVRSGADVLVNLTNDAWFGTRDGIRTHALWQHPAHLVLRAVETRTPVLRAANTGISMAVDRRGRVVARTPLFQEARILVELPVSPGGAEPGVSAGQATLFVRTGDLVGPACALAALVALVAGWGGGRGRGHTPVEDG